MRGVEIELDSFDPPTTTFVDSSGMATGPPALALRPGGVERLHIRTRARTDRVRWHAELLLLVDGRRRVVSIGDANNPFVIVGASELSSSIWDGIRWLDG